MDSVVMSRKRIFVGVLGPFVLFAENGPNASCELTAAKPRKILALLSMHANQVISYPAMAKELWGDEPPASAKTTLQTYILQIRKMLGSILSMSVKEVTRDVLLTHADGYKLQIHLDELDLHRFERLVSRARQAIAGNDDDLALRLLSEALDLWRGEPLVDIQPGPILQGKILRLEEQRLTALQLRIDASLRLNRHGELLGELAGLTALYPLDENLQAQYMLALYRSGRRPDALNVFRRLRRRLIQELGLEPSPKIQQLQHAILATDPALDNAVLHGSGLLLDRLPNYTWPRSAS